MVCFVEVINGFMVLSKLTKGQQLGCRVRQMLIYFQLNTREKLFLQSGLKDILLVEYEMHSIYYQWYSNTQPFQVTALLCTFYSPWK